MKIKTKTKRHDNSQQVFVLSGCIMSDIVFGGRSDIWSTNLGCAEVGTPDIRPPPQTISYCLHGWRHTPISYCLHGWRHTPWSRAFFEAPCCTSRWQMDDAIRSGDVLHSSSPVSGYTSSHCALCTRGTQEDGQLIHGRWSSHVAHVCLILPRRPIFTHAFFSVVFLFLIYKQKESLQNTLILLLLLLLLFFFLSFFSANFDFLYLFYFILFMYILCFCFHLLCLIFSGLIYVLFSKKKKKNWTARAARRVIENSRQMIKFCTVLLFLP